MQTSKIERINKSFNLSNRPILKKILENSEPLQGNVVDFIEKTENFKENMVGIIKASGKDLARLAGAAMNSAIEVPVQIVKLECIQDVLIEIRQKLETMPVEDLYKVYTSSSPIAIAIEGVKVKIDNAINEFLSEQCKENIPRLMSVIDTAYDTAIAASAAIDRISGEENNTPIQKNIITMQQNDSRKSKPLVKKLPRVVTGGAKSYARKYSCRRKRTHNMRRCRSHAHKLRRKQKNKRNCTTKRKKKHCYKIR